MSIQEDSYKQTLVSNALILAGTFMRAPPTGLAGLAMKLMFSKWGMWIDHFTRNTVQLLITLLICIRRRSTMTKNGQYLLPIGDFILSYTCAQCQNQMQIIPSIYAQIGD